MLPPFKDASKPFSKGEVSSTRDIANRRIVVENAIRRMLCYDILNVVFLIAGAQSQLVSDMVKVIAMLCNMRPALR